MFGRRRIFGLWLFTDYAKANIPMLPHTHGVPYTKLNIVLYTVLLTCISTLPYIVWMSGWIYLTGITLANMVFLWYALRLYFSEDKTISIKTFRYSIYYLGILFTLLLADHYLL